MTQQQLEAAAEVARILRPFVGTGEPYYPADPDWPEGDDRIGPDEPVREIVQQVLRDLGVGGMGGCGLCLS